MNQRNIEAMRELIGQWHREHGHDGKVPLSDWLPSQGVLVPSALTQLEAWSVGDKGHDYGSDAHMTEIAVETVAALERIAKGEG